MGHWRRHVIIKSCRIICFRVLLLLPLCKVRIHIVHASQPILRIHGDGVLCTVPHSRVSWLCIFHGLHPADIQKHQERLKGFHSVNDRDGLCRMCNRRSCRVGFYNSSLTPHSPRTRSHINQQSRHNVHGNQIVSRGPTPVV